METRSASPTSVPVVTETFPASPSPVFNPETIKEPVAAGFITEDGVALVPEPLLVLSTGSPVSDPLALKATPKAVDTFPP